MVGLDQSLRRQAFGRAGALKVKPAMDADLFKVTDTLPVPTTRVLQTLNQAQDTATSYKTVSS